MADTANDQPIEDPGPGCLPAVLATGVLILIIGFIACGVGTWWLYQQRTDLAIRALRGSVIPELQQSELPPEDKRETVLLLEEIVQQGESGQLEDWQVSGVMERLNRSAILHWGALAVLEERVAQSPEMDEQEQADGVRQLSRFRRALRIHRAGVQDVEDVLVPVLEEHTARGRPKLKSDPTVEQLRDAVQRARLVADREEIPAEDFQVTLAEVVREDIQQGLADGGL